MCEIFLTEISGTASGSCIRGRALRQRGTEEKKFAFSVFGKAQTRVYITEHGRGTSVCAIKKERKKFLTAIDSPVNL